MKTSLDAEVHQSQSIVGHSARHDTETIVILDNGSYSIKAGFAGKTTPCVQFQNCALQAFGRRDGRNISNVTSSSTGSSAGQPNATSHNIHGRHSHLFVGDDIYTIPESLCQRPFSHGLLVDGDLEVAIWEKLFSKAYLNLSDTSSFGVLVTEHCNTPTACRYALTQIIFEEFGFDRLVISPGQQLVPFAFSVGLPPQPVPLGEMHDLGAICKGKSKRSAGKDFSTVKSWRIGDVPRTLSPSHPGRYCQIVVDVGHQTTWIVPLYRDMPVDTASVRVDIGGAHISALLRHLLCYRQIDLERHELLIHHIKEESCFVSLNYVADLRLARTFLPYPSACGAGALTHLTHRYYLPNLNVKEKSSIKRLFKTSRATHIPQYNLKTDSSNIEEPQFYPIGTRHASLADLLTSEKNDTQCNTQCNTEKPDSMQGIFTPDSHESLPVVYMNIERIKPPELLFYPSDYQLTRSATRELPNLTTQSRSSARPFGGPPHTDIGCSPVETLEPFPPENQCGIADAIFRAIFFCSPPIQPYMAQRILLCGGSSCLPNFARRLYSELRSRLPQDWPICIYQQQFPAITSWMGGSLWAAGQDYSNYNDFALSRAQYMETG